jgi:hypothetical protein
MELIKKDVDTVKSEIQILKYENSLIQTENANKFFKFQEKISENIEVISKSTAETNWKKWWNLGSSGIFLVSSIISFAVWKQVESSQPLTLILTCALLVKAIEYFCVFCHRYHDPPKN